IGLFLLIVALAVFGPLLAPHSQSAIVGPPLRDPSSAFPLGTDYLGRDVLSRLLLGGRTILVVSLIGIALSYLIAIPVGLLAGYRGGVFDFLTQRGWEILIAFPALIVVLLLFAGAGNHLWVVVVGLIIVTVPRVALIIRSATSEVRVRGFVERAEA